MLVARVVTVLRGVCGVVYCDSGLWTAERRTCRILCMVQQLSGEVSDLVFKCLLCCNGLPHATLRTSSERSANCNGSGRA